AAHAQRSSARGRAPSSPGGAKSALNDRCPSLLPLLPAPPLPRAAEKRARRPNPREGERNRPERRRARGRGETSRRGESPCRPRSASKPLADIGAHPTDTHQRRADPLCKRVSVYVCVCVCHGLKRNKTTKNTQPPDVSPQEVAGTTDKRTPDVPYASDVVSVGPDRRPLHREQKRGPHVVC
ncbi:unnamed protein product, partial [Ixodes persulcatus]